KTESRSAQCFTSVCKTLPGLGAGVPAIVDLTGDLVLSRGALLDVSSGGRITNRGLLALDSSGRAAGKGGSVTLGTYFGNFSTGGGVSPAPVTTGALAAAIRLPGSDGSAQGNASALTQLISAYGLSQGGALSLRVLSFDIGAGAGPGSTGALALSASFF